MSPVGILEEESLSIVKAFVKPHPTDAQIEAFVAHFTPLIQRPVNNLLRAYPQADAEQVLVDVFFRLWQKRMKLPQDKTVVFYLLRVAHSVAVDAYRAQKRRPTVAPLFPMDGTETQASAGAPSLQLELQELLQALPPDARSYFLQYYDQGYSAKEIAALHGVKLPTVYTKLRRAKQSLQKKARESDAAYSAGIHTVSIRKEHLNDTKRNTTHQPKSGEKNP